jgi:hypothetical protein
VVKRYFSTRLVTPLLVLMISALLCSSAFAADMKIDRIDTEEWEAKGKLTFYIDILNESGEVEEDLQADTLKVFVDDQEVPGSFEIKTFQEAEKSVSLGIILMAHNQYMPQEPEEDDEGNKVAIEKKPFDAQKKGYANLIRELGNSDRVHVWILSNTGLEKLKGWNANYRKTASLVLKKDAEFEDSAGDQMPNFLKWMKSAAKKFANDGDGAQRKILMVVSDGADKAFEKSSSSKVEAKFEKLAEEIVEQKVKVYTICYSKDSDERFGILEGLSQSTGGVSRRIEPARDVKQRDGTMLGAAMNPEDIESISETIELLGQEIKKQYVITFTPEDFDGAEEPVEIRLEGEAPESKSAVKATKGGVELKEKAFDWVMLIVWILVGLLVVLLLFFFIRWLVLRARRPKEEVYYEEDDGPTGPYKGKLSVQGGPMVGSEFYLTEDVTTIGRMDGNDVVLQGAGISQRHAGIKIEDMRFELADFGSTNGTLVNGNKITKQFLRDEDKIVIGDCEMRFTLK